MKREEIHKLLGGYASDTLTESERRILFEAALADQELFDALAREQALRDLLQDPQARQQLLDSLAAPAAPVPRRVWRPAALWTAASLAAALVTVAVLLEWRTPPAPPVQVAAVRAPAPPEINRPAPLEPEPAPPPPSAARVPPAPPPRAKALGQAAAEEPTRAKVAKAQPPDEDAALRMTPMAGFRPMAGIGGAPPPTPLTAQNLPLRARLSLHYSILRGDTAVSAGTVLHVGDPVRLSLVSDQDAFLYVLERAPAGTWRMLFNGSVEAGKPTLVPAGEPLRYAQPGARTWLAVLSRNPDVAIENLVPERLHALSLQARGGPPKTALQPTFAATGALQERVRVSITDSPSLAVEVPLDFQ